MTSYQRRWDVITSHRRWNDVILTLGACLVYLVHRTILRRQFEYCIHNIKLYIELYEKQQNKIHVKVLVQFFLFFVLTVVVLSVLGLLRCPIFCPFVRGATTSDCPSVDLTSRAFFTSCLRNRLNSLSLSSYVLFAQTFLLTRNCLCESASLKLPLSTKAFLRFLTWPLTRLFSWVIKSKRGCFFQSIACYYFLCNSGIAHN